MSELADDPNHEKITAIKTSTFYNKKKLYAFPKLVKTRAQPTNVKENPNQTINRSTKKAYSRHSSQNKTQKLPMFGKGTSRKKLFKTNRKKTDIERLTNCKASDITDLQKGKRSSVKMGGDDGQQFRMCKKMKLDMNKNIEPGDKFSTGSELFSFGISEDEENLEKQTTKFNSENRASPSRSSPNVNDRVLITDQGKASNRSNKKYENDSLFGISSSSSESGDSLEGANQNNAKSNSSRNENDNILIVEEKEPFHRIKDAEHDKLGSPSSYCRSEDRLASQNITKSTCSSNIGDDSLIIDQKELSDTIKESEYGILGTGNSSSQSKDSLKGTTKNSRTSRKKMGSLDAFFSIGNTKTSKTKEKLKDSSNKSKEKLKDSGCRESFVILGELSSQEARNCSSTEASPLLLSQSSTSTGYSGSSKSKSVSPDSQSSITKYFTPLRKSTSTTALKNTSVSPTTDKKGKRIAKGRKATSPSLSPVTNKKEQMFLDLGQKNFGHTTCPTCNMVYTSAQPEDEAYHVKFHHKVVTGLHFAGWKTERVVEHFDDGRVIVVLPQDPFWHLKKVASVRTVVDDELGFSSETSLRMQDSKTYLFISDKKVVGCVVAVGIQEAFPLLPCTTNGDKSERSEQGAWCCSSAPARAQCGISRVWVLQQYRRKRIASRILDCVRYEMRMHGNGYDGSDFMFGGMVAKELLAFSDPTPLGKQLAESYCGGENFLVFR